MMKRGIERAIIAIWSGTVAGVVVVTFVLDPEFGGALAIGTGVGAIVTTILMLFVFPAQERNR